MAIKETTRVWDTSKQTGSGLLLMLALSDYANDWGYCWPGRNELAQRTRTNKATVTRLINKAVADKEICVRHHQATGEGNLYLIIVGLPEEEQQQRIERFAEAPAPGRKRSPGGSQKITGGVAKDHRGGDLATHKTVLDPSIEPSTNHQSSNGNGTKPLTAWQQQLKDFAIPLCKLAGVDYELNKKHAGTIAGELIKAGYSKEQIPAFEKHWYSREFPGGMRDRKRPSLAAIKNYFGWVKDDVDDYQPIGRPKVEKLA